MTATEGSTARTETPASRPILFSGEMVRAILDGRKTQTRRVVMAGRRFPQDSWVLNWNGQTLTRTVRDGIVFNTECGRPARSMQDAVVRCPYGQPGDRLWVREAFTGPAHIGDGDQGVVGFGIEYRADGAFRAHGDCGCEGRCSGVRIAHPWKPSIHMPRWGSRLTLEITGVRVERVQEITYSDVLAEGCPTQHSTLATPDDFLWYECYWNTLNERRGYGWHSNPWVWVIEFRRAA